MKFIKLNIFLILVLTVYSVYEDCMYVESEYTLKNSPYDSDHKRYDPKDGNPVYQDTKFPANFTFVASKADDCKNRKLRPYTDNRYFYDSQKDDERDETFYTHCCYYTYDEMDKYEYNKVEYEFDKDNYDTKLKTKEGYKGACIALTDLEYNNIKEYKLHMELNSGRYKNLKIDCNSYYLQFFILNLLLLFLF